MAKREQQKGPTVTLSLNDMPEVLAELRLELAGLLRAEAERSWRDGEQNVIDSAVRQALHRVAGVFEAGLKSVTDVEAGADGG